MRYNNGEGKKELYQKMDPLGKALSTVGWSCPVSFLLFLIDATLYALYPGIKSVALIVGDILALIFVATLIPAIFWFVFRREYMRRRFDEMISKLEGK